MEEERTWFDLGETTGKFSGGSEQYFFQLDHIKAIFLRCVIKMTKYTPISGGNITELNKIPE